MEFPRSLEAWGSVAFKEIFLEEVYMNKNRLPIDDFCTGGGWPEDPEFEMREMIRASMRNGTILY